MSKASEIVDAVMGVKERYKEKCESDYQDPTTWEPGDLIETLSGLRGFFVSYDDAEKDVTIRFECKYNETLYDITVCRKV
ncbi:MAG: hypothetical protein GY820_17300 [Gammaproteobacteria bacterium]|nr:hypothetical protein [Gammaproteobacteria bacterium]